MKNIEVCNNGSDIINISHDVLMVIVDNVVKGIPGIAEKEVSLLSKVWEGKVSQVHGYVDNILRISVKIKVYYGSNIPLVAKHLQDEVGKEIKLMLDIDNIAVDVYVTNLAFRN